MLRLDEGAVHQHVGLVEQIARGRIGDALRQLLVAVARVRPHVQSQLAHLARQCGARGGLLERLAARNGDALHQLVGSDLRHHVGDGAHRAARAGLAVGVVAPRTAVRAALHEHGIAQPRPIDDGIRSRAVKTYSVGRGHVQPVTSDASRGRLLRRAWHR